MHADKGSASVVGVALVSAAALLLSALMAGATLLLCQSRAQTAADMAALSAAQSWWMSSSQNTACAIADEVSEANAGILRDCVVDGDDVQVRVAVDTHIPLLARVEKQARAGPRPCSAS